MAVPCPSDYRILLFITLVYRSARNYTTNIIQIVIAKLLFTHLDNLYVLSFTYQYLFNAYIYTFQKKKKMNILPKKLCNLRLQSSFSNARLEIVIRQGSTWRPPQCAKEPICLEIKNKRNYRSGSKLSLKLVKYLQLTWTLRDKVGPAFQGSCPVVNDTAPE